jgi:hypothetical protein
LPLDPALALTATLRGAEGWTVTVARRRDEASYRSAIDAAMRATHPASGHAEADVVPV